MGTQQFCLRWNNHQTNLLAVFDQLLQNEAFVDVTLACEGLSIKAHKMVLSACSPYFQSLFVDNPCQHPIVILKDVRFSELKAVVDFMYKGEVNVSQDQLSALLKTAETLKVKGLAEVTGGSDPSGSASDGVTRSTLGPSLSSQGGPPSQRSDGSLSPAPKRKRGRPSKRPSQDGDLEVVESLVDVVPDGPDSVPSNQDRSMDSTQNVKDLLSEPPQSMADQTLNTTTDMAYDGIPQDHTSNSRDSGMMMADQQQSSSSSSLGQLPATASTSGMSPGQGYSTESSILRRSRKAMKYKAWSVNDMMKAMEMVLASRMSIPYAARRFKVPESTLQYRVDCMRGKNYRKFRVDVFLTRDEERTVVKEVRASAEQGKPMTEREIACFAVSLVRRTSEDRADKLASDELFQQRWFNSFRRKHVDLVVAATPESDDPSHLLPSSPPDMESVCITASPTECNIDVKVEQGNESSEEQD